MGLGSAREAGKRLIMESLSIPPPTAVTIANKLIPKISKRLPNPLMAPEAAKAIVPI